MSRDLASLHLFFQPEQRVEPSEAENCKRPPRQANTRAGKDYQVSGINNEKQERRTRNKDKHDRVVWAPLLRADGSNISEDQPPSSAANNGEVKERTLLQKFVQVANSSGGHTLENGSARQTGCHVGARNRKEDGFVILLRVNHPVEEVVVVTVHKMYKSN